VEGAVVDRHGSGRKAQVVLVPDNRERVDLFQSVCCATNVAGSRFAAPRQARTACWRLARFEPFAYFDPALLKHVESAAVTIRVTEAPGQVVTIKVIPPN
jgi:hypothetical protein